MGPAHGRSHPDFGGDSFHPRVALGARLTLIVGVVRIADDFVDIPVSRPMRQYAAPVQADDARGADPAFVEIHQVSLFFSVQRTDHPLTPEWRNRYLIGLSRRLGMPSDSLLNSQSEKKSCQEIAASGPRFSSNGSHRKHPALQKGQPPLLQITWIQPSIDNIDWKRPMVLMVYKGGFSLNRPTDPAK